MCVIENLPSSAAAAVRRRSIVGTNKGHRGHLHFHKGFAREDGEARGNIVLFGMDLR